MSDPAQVTGQGSSVGNRPGRLIQSSPVRGLGTQHSPIDLDEYGSTRRVLFPSPNKERGDKALQDITHQDNRQSEQPKGRETMLKHQNSSTSDKENLTPAESVSNDDLDKLFQDGDSSQEPRTPPSRMTPSSQMVGSSTRSTLRRRMHALSSSPWKFNLSPTSQRRALALRTPRSRTSTTTTTTTTAMSTRNKSRSPGSSRGGSNQVSPFTAQMYQLLSEGNNCSPISGGRDLFGLDSKSNSNSLPTTNDQNHNTSTALDDLLFLPLVDHDDGEGEEQEEEDGLPNPHDRHSPSHQNHLKKGRPSIFSLVRGTGSDDVFSTDHLGPIPSSPPNFFALYEDPVEPSSGIWSDFDLNGVGE